MKVSIFFIINLIYLCCNNVIGSPAKIDMDASSLSVAMDQINRLSNNLEKFNTQYLINLEQKIASLTSTVNSIDSNLKSLIDKSQIWELYRHHIDAFDDHMKSIEHKIELIKYNQEDTKFIDGKLTSIEFLLNHIISKMVQNANKDCGHTNNENKTKMYGPIGASDVLKFLNDEKLEQKELLLRLNNILKHVLNIENSNCRISRGLRLGPPSSQAVGSSIENNNDILKNIEFKINEFLTNLSLKDMKQFAQAGRKNTKSLEDVLRIVTKLDDRTLRLYDSEAEHSSKLLNSCQTASNELSTFTESSDLLLKRIEKLVLNVEKKIDHILTSKTGTSFIDEEIEEKNVIPDYKDYKDYSIDLTTITPTPDFSNELDLNNEYTENFEFEFLQPLKTGCHDLNERYEGVYKFNVPEKNEADRDFNERYCAFPTEGVGWTVIQKRGPYEYQEKFNRSWSDYRNGFGNLNKEFWFGNEFIHRIVYTDSYELRIELEDFNNTSVWSEYSIFQIDSEKYNYNLIIGGYNGAVRDSMLYHHNQDFSTFDRRNDKSIDLCCSCSTGYGSGWWFNDCLEANLNGIYHNTPFGHNNIGIIWENWHGDYSLKKTRMLIRPKSIWKDSESEIIGTEIPIEP